MVVMGRHLPSFQELLVVGPGGALFLLGKKGGVATAREKAISLSVIRHSVGFMLAFGRG
jgi:hypothetical protein